MKTRSGQRTKIYIDKLPTKFKRHFLMANQMRKGADHVPHECKICLGKLMFTQYCINWFQCPSCQEVTHADCLLKHMRRSSI